MNPDILYLPLLNFTIPVFSGICCIILLQLSFGDNRTRTEQEVKRVAMIYLLCASFSWFATFLYGYFPHLFLPINILTYLSYLYTQVFFYRLFHILTQLNDKDGFSKWHYLPPLIISGVLLAWSCFVPYTIQLEIVKARGICLPEGYEAFARFFSFKPPMRLLFSIVYTILIVVRLVRYYRHVNNTPNLIRRLKSWVLLLAFLSMTAIVSTAFGTFLPRTIVFHSMLPLIGALCIASQHIILTYHIIRRDYMLFITIPGRKHPLLSDLERTISKPAVPPHHQSAHKDDSFRVRKSYTRTDKPLTHRRLEDWVKKHKPFLSPSFKITELAEAFDTNRTYISNFVNRTYGINFNRYLNRLRLNELDRLTKMHSNKDQNLRHLITKAGFTDYKHYMRALQTEKDDRKEEVDDITERSEP